MPLLPRLACLLIFFAFCLSAQAQPLMRIKPKKPIVCYYTTEAKPHYIPPPEEYLRARSARTKSSEAVFEVTFVGFPNAARDAFQQAVDIWSVLLSSPITIHITAKWEPLPAGVLGQAIWSEAFANFDGAQHINTYYPVALAEKMAGVELNDPENSDIDATFSSNANWYFGLDGNAAGKMDLVTVALHEIAHGLGFTDSYSSSGTSGMVGIPTHEEPIPFIYDLFIENLNNESLFEEFPSPSSALKTQLTSGQIYFNSSLAKLVNGGLRPQIFAPASFNPGSSISHLDEQAFPKPGANSLMTPQIATGEAIHSPGQILLNIFSDLGWIHTQIQHEPLNDTETLNGNPYPVLATIISDNGFDPDSLKLKYTTDSITFQSIVMTPTANPDEYSAQLPGSVVPIQYSYYISVWDDLDREFTAPGQLQRQGVPSEQGFNLFRAGADTMKPVVIHEPVQFVEVEDTSLVFLAMATDNVGLEDVTVEYYTVNEGNVIPLVMTDTANTGQYVATLDLPDTLEIGDLIRYRIVARDSSSNNNVRLTPGLSHHTILVTGIMSPRDVYENDFNSYTIDFKGKNFMINKISGFKDGAINSQHPYKNSFGAPQNSYVYQLQIPLKIKADSGDFHPTIQFDEIVLVEPSEVGATFGEEGFYDYVIVEGSKDEGETWLPFLDGYSSRANSAWLHRWESNLFGINSLAVADSALYYKRTINMLSSGNFEVGDLVMVRFRMYSDESANGWGWAIDNLSIQGAITTPVEPVDPERAVTVYPNPVLDKITIEADVSKVRTLAIDLLSSQGKSMYTHTSTLITETNYKHVIDVQDFSRGLYIVKMNVDGKIVTRKFIKSAP